MLSSAGSVLPHPASHKVSDLIAQLQAVERKHGDLSIVYWDRQGACAVTPEHLLRVGKEDKVVYLGGFHVAAHLAQGNDVGCPLPAAAPVEQREWRWPLGGCGMIQAMDEAAFGAWSSAKWGDPDDVDDHLGDKRCVCECIAAVFARFGGPNADPVELLRSIVQKCARCIPESSRSPVPARVAVAASSTLESTGSVVDALMYFELRHLRIFGY